MAAKTVRNTFLFCIAAGLLVLVALPMVGEALSCGTDNNSNFLCEAKVTDWALVFFTYALVVVGWFTMRSNENTVRALERAYIFLSHGGPGIFNGFVTLELQAVNQGRTFGVLKEIKYKFVRELPRTPSEANWDWNILEYDWTLPATERRSMKSVTSDLTGPHYFAGCLTYQDAFTRRTFKSWTAIEFDPQPGKGAGNKRGGGDPWNTWE